jgi:hypothetical protein
MIALFYLWGSQIPVRIIMDNVPGAPLQVRVKGVGVTSKEKDSKEKDAAERTKERF